MSHHIHPDQRINLILSIQKTYFVGPRENGNDGEVGCTTEKHQEERKSNRRRKPTVNECDSLLQGNKCVSTANTKFAGSWQFLNCVPVLRSSMSRHFRRVWPTRTNLPFVSSELAGTGNHCSPLEHNHYFNRQKCAIQEHIKAARKLSTYLQDCPQKTEFVSCSTLIFGSSSLTGSATLVYCVTLVYSPLNPDSGSFGSQRLSYGNWAKT
jgi:hypothetical protein